MMQVVTPKLVSDKKVLLRLDLDVPLRNAQGKPSLAEDFRLKAGLPTLKMCLEKASEVVIMGHLGRPEGREVPALSVAPIYDWLEDQGFSEELEKGKLKLLENLRFEKGEEECRLEYAKELASLGDVFINEAFASYHQSASTMVLPTLLPHFAGLRFAREVKELGEARDNPKRPLVVIIGGAKVEDKLPVVEAMSKIADYVLVGGKIAQELSAVSHQSSDNILMAELNEAGTDVSPQTLERWKPMIQKAKMTVWNGPLGKIEEPKNFQTHELANLIIQSGTKSIVGGGDTIGYLGKLGLLGKFGWVSTGGGAMLEFLVEGTLPTIEALK